MLIDRVAEALNLKSNAKRNFLLSVSGGADSTVLLYLLHELKKTYSGIRLRVFHVNFQLRGRDSIKDEKFVESLSKKLKISFSKIRVKKNIKTLGIQEWARKERLKASLRFASKYELVEAHHLDDQIETFFLRLLRGAGVAGLSCMTIKSLRGSRVVWRPLLKVSKVEILKYIKDKKIPFREDQTNKKDIYDRNWLRLKVLPLLYKKAPQFRDKLDNLIEELQEIQAEKKKNHLTNRSMAVKSKEELDWVVLKGWSGLQRKSFIHSYFQEDLGIFLSRQQILTLDQKLAEGESFSFNAPKGIIIRGFKPSRQYPTGKLKIQNS